MLTKTNHSHQKKSLLINRLSLEICKEPVEELSTPLLQEQEDIHYFEDLLQVSLHEADIFEND